MLKSKPTKISLLQLITFAFMIFSMAFGAGNLTFPLIAGHDYCQLWIWVALGFVTSACLISWLGLLATFQYAGNYCDFLKTQLGAPLMYLLATTSMLLLGPVGCMPRCIITAYSNLELFIPFISHLGKPLFSSIFISVLILLGWRKSNVVRVLGQILGPLCLSLIFMLMIKAALTPAASSYCNLISPSWQQILWGIGQGAYNSMFTFDLLAMVFYAAVVHDNILSVIKKQRVESDKTLKLEINAIASKAGLWAMGFLGCIYIGFIGLSAKHAYALPKINHEVLLTAYMQSLWGAPMGMITAIIVSLACFSTTFALLVVFADYLSHQLTHSLGYKLLSYHQALVISAITSIILANLSFSGIVALSKPFTYMAYPLLILAIAKVGWQHWRKQKTGIQHV